MPKPAPSNRPGSARQRSAAFRAAQRRAERRRRVLIWVAAALVIAAAAVGLTAAVRGSDHASATGPTTLLLGMLTGPAGPEGIVLEQGQLLAPASTSADGQTIKRCRLRCQRAGRVPHPHAPDRVRQRCIATNPRGRRHRQPGRPADAQQCVRQRVPLLLLAARARPGWHHPYRIADHHHVHPRSVLRRSGTSR